jgi:hypothetical protein
VPVFDGMNPRYKRILWTVIGINGAMFLTEMIAGQLAGSQALKADALDFLADTVTYGLSLAVIGASLRRRASAALLKGISLSAMALWVFGSTIYQTLVLEQILIKLNRILRPGSSWRIRLAGTLGGRRRLRAGGSRRSWRLLCAGSI